MSIRRITIRKTQGEWKLIQNRIREFNSLTINSYILTRISKLKTKYLDCPDCVTCGGGKKISKQFAVKDDVYELLLEISKKMNRPVSSIIDDLYITPLLAPK